MTQLDPSTKALQRAAADNHISWFLAANRARGNVADDTPGAAWMCNAAELTLAFPEMDDPSRWIDERLEYARARRPIRMAGCWSLLPTVPPDLGARLVARGFDRGWQPHWMHLDLDRLIEPCAVAGVDIERVAQHPTLGDEPHPTGERPENTYFVSASVDGRRVGRAVVHVTDVAGIYGVDVIDEFRNRGIGKAVSAEVCRIGREHGCRSALLNATFLGEMVYRRLGFESAGHGQSWWMNGRRLDVDPPSAEDVAVVEGAVRGDLSSIPDDPSLLERIFACELGLVEIAVANEQRDLAIALVEERGAVPDVTTCRVLGWRDRIQSLVAQHPSLLGRRRPDGATALHVAAYDGDDEVCAWLVGAGADLTLVDSVFSGPPSGWARAGGHVELAERLEPG